MVLIPALTAAILSRLMFSFLNDPEGPNLLIVIVMAVVIYVSSRVICMYFVSIKQTEIKGVLLQIVFQVLVAAILCFILLKF